MPFNVLLLPLLGGYIFITYWHRTRYSARRYTGERLLFHAALAGVVFLVISFWVTRVTAGLSKQIYDEWHALVPFPHAGVSFGAFLLGALAWYPMNQVFDATAEIRKTIERSNDYLEILLSTSTESTRHVAITLKSGKVYVGPVMDSFDPANDRRFVVLLPMVSGYREATTHKLVLNTDYTAVYKQMVNEGKADDADNFRTVIPVQEILSATLFDWDAYAKFTLAEDSTHEATEGQS
jgi:hypothetical protein